MDEAVEVDALKLNAWVKQHVIDGADAAYQQVQAPPSTFMSMRVFARSWGLGMFRYMQSDHRCLEHPKLTNAAAR